MFSRCMNFLVTPSPQSKPLRKDPWQLHRDFLSQNTCLVVFWISITHHVVIVQLTVVRLLCTHHHFALINVNSVLLTFLLLPIQSPTSCFSDARCLPASDPIGEGERLIEVPRRSAPLRCPYRPSNRQSRDHMLMLTQLFMNARLFINDSATAGLIVLGLEKD